MNRQAYKQDVSGVGYVVAWCEDGILTPLRNFGDYQSAAIEFARMINQYVKDDLDRRIKTLACTYDPEIRYSYPKPAKIGIAILPKQRI